MEIKNKHKVNKALWNKFKTDAAKKIFNDVMEQSLKNQGVTSHPEMPKMTKEQWHTLCWNFSCYAAWSVRNEKLEKGAVVIDMIKGKEVKRQIAK